MAGLEKKLGVLVCLVSLVAVGGCSSLQLPSMTNSYDGPNYSGVDPGMLLDPADGEKVYRAVRQANARNGIVLHVLGDSDPIRVLPLPANGQPVTISQLLKQSGAAEKLGTINVSLIRRLPSAPNGLRMNVRMDSEGKQVRPETDYTLQSGDRVQIAKGRGKKVENLIGAMLGIST